MCLHGNVHNVWVCVLAAPPPSSSPGCLPGRVASAYKHSGCTGVTGAHCVVVRGFFQQH